MVLDDLGDSLKGTLKKIANGSIVNQQKVINYLKCLDKTTIHGYFGLEDEKEPTKKKKKKSKVKPKALEKTDDDKLELDL